MRLNLYQGDLFYFIDSPFESTAPYCFVENGGLLVENGEIKQTGLFDALRKDFPEATVIDYSGRLIMPGFIDAHIHFPQSEMVGMYGKQLNEWLDQYTYPIEQLYHSEEYSETMAEKFLQELFKNGTTACAAYATVHANAANALFDAASRYDMCMLTGKVLMNRNAPADLQDTVSAGESESLRLIERWHEKGRNRYVVTPRFAITSTSEQLESAGCLYASFTNLFLQTHIAENKEEIKRTLELFPDCQDYLEVYEKAGLISERTILGHGIHLSDNELSRISAAGSIIAHCPTSNTFLGSGLFDMHQANLAGVQNVIATDVAGGTSFSMFKTMGEAYKVQQLNGYALSPLEAYYKTTLGVAKTLQLSDSIGSLLPGMEADFIVVDYAVTSEQEMRSEYLQKTNNWGIENRLFGLQIVGDDRNIRATYIKGEKVYDRNIQGY